jgi:putative ABC transport system permease protein
MVLDTLKQDVAYAIRGVRRKPGFTIAVVATLALGIGANAAMFGIVDRLLFRPPPLLRDAERTHRPYLFQTYRDRERANEIMAYARYTDIATATTSFDRVAAHSLRRLAVGVGESAREMRVGAVSASFFGFFDAPPAIGRYFTADEDRPPVGAPVAVLSHATWRTLYGGRTDALGATIQIGPTVYTVIGVAPPSFAGLWPDQPPAAFIPITSYAGGTDFRSPNRSWWTTYGWSWMAMIAHRKPGITVDQANADLLNAFNASLDNQRVEQPTMPPQEAIRTRALAGSILAERGPNRSSVTRVATWVGGISVIVLLIACANVANLLLARALSRRREIALRLALGVGRARLLSQLLTESVLLALLGGAAGLMVAHLGGNALRMGLLETSEAGAGLRDARTVLFALAAALAVGLLTGLAPVLQATRANLVGDLKAGRGAGIYARSTARVALLVLQGALSVVLLVGAGLFVRSLGNVMAVRLGYDADPVLLVETNMRGVALDSAQTMALRLRLLDAAKAIPGVQNASLQNAVPFYSTRSRSLHVAGIDTVAKLGSFDMNAVSPEYFATLGTRIVRGRGIGTEDAAHAPRVIVVSEAMAKVLWPGRDPIGQCIRVGSGGGRDTFDPATVPCTTVVGIAENIKEQSLAGDAGYYYYLPAAQFHPTHGGLFVRTRGDARDLAESVRRGLQQAMPGTSYVTITPLGDIVGRQRRSWHLGAATFVAFGALALILAAVGLYSVIAYNVAQRAHEIGVRVALGAQSGRVATLVLADGLRITLAGVAIGTVAALLAARWVQPLLFDVSARDPVVLALVAAILIAVALLASWIPARRASRVDAIVVLRAD